MAFNLRFNKRLKKIKRPMAAGLQRHRSKAEVQRKAGTNIEKSYLSTQPPKNKVGIAVNIYL